jgi:ribose transport system substrate-binding protein
MKRSRVSALWLASWAGLVILICCLTIAARLHSSALRIAFVPRTTGSTLWESEHAGAADAAKIYESAIYWNAPTHEDDVEDQIALVERIGQGRFAGLVLAPDHSLALLTPVERVVAAGTPVIIVSSQLALRPGPNLSYIVNDDEEAGRMAARRLGSILQGTGHVAVLGLDPDVTGIQARLRTFENYLHEHYPKIDVVSRGPGAFNAAEAQQATLAALFSGNQVNAMVSLTAVSTRAAYFTLRSNNRCSTVKLIGFEQDSDLTDSVKKGQTDSIIAEDTYRMGFLAVKELTALHAGQKIPARIVLPPLLVTKENADSPEVKRLINMVFIHAK